MRDLSIIFTEAVIDWQNAINDIVIQCFLDLDRSISYGLSVVINNS